MTKFKVGDRVKTKYGFGKIVEIKEDGVPYLVYHDSWDKGHNGNGYSEKEYSGNHCMWFIENEFELVEPQITSEININSSGIGVKIKDNSIIEKKEGNDMLESLNLVDLYAYKQKEIINNKYSKMIEDIRKKSSIKEQYDKITQNCINELNDLFVSQFSDEEREELKEKISGCSGLNKEMKRKTSCYEFGYYIDTNYVNEEIKELQEKCENELKELDNLIKTVKAHVSIAKIKEEVEEILTRYEILDKKGKLKI